MQVATVLWRICINNSSRFASFSKEEVCRQVNSVCPQTLARSEVASATPSEVRGALRAEAVDTGGAFAHTELDNITRYGGHVRVGKGSPQPSAAEGYSSLRLSLTLHWLRCFPAHGIKWKAGVDWDVTECRGMN